VEIVASPLEDIRPTGPPFDAVVASLVFCSVPDLPHTLQLIKGLLRPGGRLVFLEHVAAGENTAAFRWQRLLEPLWRRATGNCHLTRRTEEAILNAGFLIERIEREELERAPGVLRRTIRGIARTPLTGNLG
jgi:SAM-dependent methyltransferase